MQAQPSDYFWHEIQPILAQIETGLQAVLVHARWLGLALAVALIAGFAVMLLMEARAHRSTIRHIRTKRAPATHRRDPEAGLLPPLPVSRYPRRNAPSARAV